MISELFEYYNCSNFPTEYLPQGYTLEGTELLKGKKKFVG